ncbi:SMP-30/gluconolactonase/LRE family protein [Mycolicibacterium duvalii]|uniref:SMP-30/gluconolactonase/LRE family protein n=1 Tax=Mycolicibacterium duvalii TaxID=39688 RepID=UPI001F1F812D|nr:SMP-30/gluconolactonase/LRE family protein [Mycolicibacterium duvalii]
MSEVRSVAEGLAFPESPIACPDGSVVLSEMAAGRISRVRPDGTVEPIADTGGGPNGVGLLADGRLVVCQNGGSTFGVGSWPYDFDGAVQLFRPLGAAEKPVAPQLQLVDVDGSVHTLAVDFEARNGGAMPLVRPSDLCVDAEGGFYVTDGGTTQGRSRTMTGLLYGTPDGRLEEIVYPLEMPNGVALSPAGDRVYVAETRTRRVWEFTLSGPGRVVGGRGLATVPSGGPLNIGGADGLCVVSDGTILVATLGVGGVTAVSPSGQLLGALPLDDPMTTNMTLSDDEATLYVTLASSGRLVAVDDWRFALDMPP